ncbi:protein EDS1L-like [Cryptomeria japonica]|uniref:protein EDS1L-like n=1 Tax=Cryptomeria japonica TaxID=3369 RepID=UPI0025AC8FB6|nr:protein EDS1L-like [Cryptomeria japonica]
MGPEPVEEPNGEATTVSIARCCSRHYFHFARSIRKRIVLYAVAEYIKACVIWGWEASCTAYKSGNGYDWQDSRYNTFCLAFSGSLDSSAFHQTETKFGACKMNEGNNYFESMDTREELALVYKEALTKFLQIWNDHLKAQVEEALETGKSVLFTGHSVGGGIATLATLAILEERGMDAPVFAITFGFPLIGDEVLARADRRQGWANHFFNIVTKGDVFARTPLVPCDSVCRFLEFFLPHWRKSLEQMNDDDMDIFMEPVEWGFPQYLRTILCQALAEFNFISITNMEGAKKLESAFNISPYRPFGYYLFCSEKGALCVGNDEAELVLPILYNSLANFEDEASISDHINYGRLFHANTNIVNLEGLPILPLSQGAPSSALEIRQDFFEFGIQ